MSQRGLAGGGVLRGAPHPTLTHPTACRRHGEPQPLQAQRVERVEWGQVAHGRGARRGGAGAPLSLFLSSLFTLFTLPSPRRILQRVERGHGRFMCEGAGGCCLSLGPSCVERGQVAHGRLHVVGGRGLPLFSLPCSLSSLLFACPVALKAPLETGARGAWPPGRGGACLSSLFCLPALRAPSAVETGAYGRGVHGGAWACVDPPRRPNQVPMAPLLLAT